MNTEANFVGGVLTPNILNMFTAKAVRTGLATPYPSHSPFVGVKFISRELLITVPCLRRAKQA